ncbi:hypothetical protein BDN70DRAFT_925428 [Pholiota conissans]|uniref:BTB domain-containing protein n=1 Tax=Pholiota conissans TaxID=109636 RepID=A0A9P6CUA2_9AGAR|nr:hypothetical protein BDN70DRAFT_925428 [Pholiota conissans]
MESADSDKDQERVIKPRKSESFNSPTADVTFLSSDSVLFKLHSSHLSVNSIGFPRADENIVVDAKRVPLSEHSDILDLLFRFVQPPVKDTSFRQPDLFYEIQYDINNFFRLAETAEKYVVFAAMNACYLTMQHFQVEYPLQILNHCVLHDYLPLANKAAKSSLTEGIDEAIKYLTAPGLLIRYLKYFSKWQDASTYAIGEFERHALRLDCPAWTYAYIMYRQQLDESCSNIGVMPQGDFKSKRCHDIECSCRSLPNVWPDWFRRLSRFTDIPDFGDFDATSDYEPNE